LYQGRQFISTMPVRELIAKLDPQPPPWVVRTVDDFHYRDSLTVALVVRDRNRFPDNQILIHDSKVKVAHIQNFKNLSPDMAPNPKTAPLILGYVCNEGDSLWSMRDGDLVRFAAGELAQLGLARGEDVLDGTVVRMPKAYPIQNETCARAIDAVRRFLKQIPNLQLVGRKGMHRDGSQDHSMLTAVLAARNILNCIAGLATRYDLWRVNAPEDESDFRAPQSNKSAAPLIILEPRGVESRPGEVHEFERTSLVRRLR
jgi:protoporphyrinogen oxidase